MKLLRSLTTVAGFTLGSRVFGFFRDMLTASFLGTGAASDAFVVALKLPSLLRRLLAEGAFNAAFVPMYAGLLAKEGKQSANSFAQEVLSVFVVCLMVIVVIAELAMPWLVRVFVPGFIATPERLELAITFCRLTFPFILFISLTALYSGILNSFDRFAAAAASPMAGNIFVIGFVLGFSVIITDSGQLLAIAITGCGVVQLLWVWGPAFWSGDGLKLSKPSLTPRVRLLLKRMAPVAVGSGVHQFNVLIGTLIASILPVGGISYLYYAERLNQLPLSVIGTAMSTVLLPLLAKSIRAGKLDDAKTMQNQGIELSMLLTVPAMIGLVILAEPMVKMLFERGAFDAAAAQQTSYALMAYSIGLPAYVLTKIFDTSFYAQEDTVTPLKVAGIAVVADIVLSLLLINSLQHIGIALATAAAAWINVIVLGYLLHRKNFFSVTERLSKFTLGLIVATGSTGGVLWYLKPRLMDMVNSGGYQRAFGVCLLIGSGLLTYVVTAQMIGILNYKELKKQFKG
jgi:putative peptidoglycan lipid II flippase